MRSIYNANNIFLLTFRLDFRHSCVKALLISKHHVLTFSTSHNARRAAQNPILQFITPKNVGPQRQLVLLIVDVSTMMQKMSE